MIRKLIGMTYSGWIKLQNVALTDMHPSWVGEPPGELLGRARTSALGRRWLARCLAPDHGLFRQLAAAFDEDNVVREHAWLCQPLAAREVFTLNLGAHALAPLLSAQVTRASVLRLRAMLGEANYRRMLDAAANDNHVTELAHAVDASSLLASEAVLREGLMQQAAAELWAFARDVHWALGERVRLTFHRRWPLSLAAARLSPDAVTACERHFPAGPETVRD